MAVTWKPYEGDGGSTDRSDLPDSAFAFPRERKEPLTDAAHVRNALARFDQVRDVSKEERQQAIENIRAAAAYYDVYLNESDWQLLSLPVLETPSDASEAAEVRRLKHEVREES